jgi:hypothetical protein
VSDKNTGDMPTLSAARAEARRNFESNRNLRIGSEELQKSLVFADEVAKFLRENVVQGQSQDGTNYSVLKHAQCRNIQLTQSQISRYTNIPSEETMRTSRRRKERLH